MDKRFQPTDLGFVVTDLLVKAFPTILDVRFTADMENRLDSIEEGKQDWIELMRQFYGPFEKSVRDAEESVAKFARETGEICPDCGSPLVEKFGRYGKFYSCSTYPTCKYIKRTKAEGATDEAATPPVESDIPCPNCGRMLVEKTGKYGKFLACPGYPTCKYIHKDPPKTTGVACPECGKGEIVEKRARMGTFYGCNRYPECKLTLSGKPITERKCPQCGGLLHERVFKGRLTGIGCANKACDYQESAKGRTREAVESGAAS